MKAVILSGGKGTRLAPYTKTLPKPLMPIGTMPILEILLRQMKCSGVDEVILAVGHMQEMLWSYFQDGSKYGIKIRYSHEDQPLGTAGPLTLIDDLDETFFVTNGDVLTTLDFQDLLQAHKKSRAAATIAMHSRQVEIDLGVLELDDDTNEIVGYIEKPTYDFRVSMGIYVFEPRVLGHIPPHQYFDFPDLVKTLIANDERVIGYPFDGYWQDLGCPDDYENAIVDFDVNRHLFLPDE